VAYINETQYYTINPDVLADPSLFDELIALGLDPLSATGSGRKASLEFGFERTSVDNVLNPRSGHVVSARFENAATWLGGSYQYRELSAEGRLYLPVGASRVLATRVRGGTLRADTIQDIPFAARYFLGGSQSLRGWGRYEVAPLTRSGQPIGGETMFEMSTEIRQMFGESFGAVVFVDAGNVWRLDAPSDLGALQVAVGPGLRYASPFGIVRADFGVQVTRIPGLLVNGEPEQRRWRIHFSIGHMF
jgi:outer membrane protein insertion porin family